MEFIFMRHGNTTKSDDDSKRTLTKYGKKQAMKREKSIGKVFDMVISSPAIRARETASLISGFDINRIILCDELYMPTNKSDGEALDRLFLELGYSSLQKYLEHDAELFSRYGECAHDAIWNKIANNHVENVLIVGHAVLLNAVAKWFNSDPIIADCSLGECEGLYLTKSSRVIHIK